MTNIPSRLTAGLKGSEGLLVAVIVRAAKDAISPGETEHYLSAWNYMKSANYSHHMDLLGLEPEMMPTMIAEMPIEQIAEGTSVLYRSAMKNE